MGLPRDPAARVQQARPRGAVAESCARLVIAWAGAQVIGRIRRQGTRLDGHSVRLFLCASDPAGLMSKSLPHGGFLQLTAFEMFPV